MGAAWAVSEEAGMARGFRLRMLGAWGLGLIWLGACQSPEASAPGRAAESGLETGREYRSRWSDAEVGREPREWVDVKEDGYRYAWLYGGDWRIARVGSEWVYEVPRAKRVPAEPLTFRRYRGEAFGENGALPRRYRAEAEGRSLGGAVRFGGYGELAMQVFYLSPTTYVEVLKTDSAVLIWEAVDAAPMQGRGWRQLARVPQGAGIGTWVRLGAEVDRERGTITALLDGKPVATARSDLLLREGPAWLTLRATGNREEWRWVEVVELGGAVAGGEPPTGLRPAE